MVQGEAHGPQPRRDDHAGLGQGGRDLRAVAAWEAGNDDPGAAVVFGRGEDLGPEPFEPRAQLCGEREVVREDVLDPEGEQVVDGRGQRGAGRVGGRRVLEPAAACARGIVVASKANASSVDFQPTKGGSRRSHSSGRR